MTELGIEKVEGTDLHPLLEQYGKDVKTTTLPDNARSYNDPEAGTSIAPESFRILDYTQDLGIPLHEYVELSGIGWIDGALHVQIHYPDHYMVKFGRDSEGFPVSAWIQMTLDDGFSPWYTHKDDLPGGTYIWLWDENGDDFPDWEEYVFPCTPAEAEQAVLKAQVRITGATTIVEGNWFVKIPLHMIQFEEKQ